MPPVGKKIWHSALETSCGAPAFNLYYTFVMLQFLLYLLHLGFITVHFICKSLQRLLRTHYLCVSVGRAQEQPGFDFPTDLPVRGVVPSIQCFGTVTMLAQTQAESPPPLFPGPWDCNTLLTKSHFPFLSNIHTPATPSPIAGMPPEKRIGVTCARLFPCPQLFPSLP